MKKNITVFYEGIRIFGGEEEKISSLSPGSYSEKDGQIYITYKDEIGSALFKIADGEMVASRFGENGTVMKFRRKNAFEFPYKTPYGVFRAEITTLDMDFTKTETGGKACIRYNLDFGGEKSENKFTLKYTFENGD